MRWSVGESTDSKAGEAVDGHIDEAVGDAVGEAVGEAAEGQIGEAVVEAVEEQIDEAVVKAGCGAESWEGGSVRRASLPLTLLCSAELLDSVSARQAASSEEQELPSGNPE